MGLIDSKKAIKALTHWETEATDEEIIYTINNLPTVEAIPIPKGATNGDILRTIFPKAKHELQKFYEEDTIVFDLDGFYMRISSDWWNSPYKENEKM